MRELDTIKITFPSDESATWISKTDLATLVQDGMVVMDEGDDLYPEDGPFRIIVDEKDES